MRRSRILTVTWLTLLFPILGMPVSISASHVGQNTQPAEPAPAQPQSAAAKQTAPTAQQSVPTKPVITGLSVSSGASGSKLTIKGTGFDPKFDADAVKFGETLATATSATGTAISTTVPANVAVGKTSVTVTTSAGTSNAWPFNVTAAAPKPSGPAITSLSAPSGAPESDLTIAGAGFGVSQGSSNVKFNDIVATVKINGWTDTAINTVVPTGLAAGSAAVTVTTSAGVSKAMAFTVVVPVTWYGVISGDFSPFINAAGNLVSPLQIAILTQDLQTIGKATSASLSPTDKGKLQMFYTQSDPKAVPAYVLIGTTSPGDHQYPFAPIAKPTGTDPTLVPYEQVISGDFCLPDKDGNCTTGLLKVDGSPPDSITQITAYVLAADGTPKGAKLNFIGKDSADVSFTAPSGFKPASLALETKAGAHTFAYAPAPPVQITDLVYESDDLETVCDLNAANKPDCINTAAGHLVLKPVASGALVTFVALQKLLVARVRAPLGLEPTAILVTNTTRNTSVIVRRTIKPGGNNNLLNVNMTIMDQLTAQRNYGNRIAKRYIVVNLDITNPTTKKVQFNKSAMYFDVDYVESREQGPTLPGFFKSIAEVSTLGLYQPSVYNAPFVAGRKGSVGPPRLARFGLEQNVKHSPENYLEVLGSFDYTTQKTDDKLKALELVGSLLSNIATGGLVADTTGAFRAGTSLFSGTFLPGVRALVLDTSFINRLRSNLVAQTLQETIQVPANGSATTKVLLPRAGILAFTDAEIPVIVNRVIDVHLETEVVSEVSETSVAKGACKIGYAREQTREALGEPTGVVTNADGTSVFTYPTGPVASASFDASGSLVSCQQRSVSDQLAEPTTLVALNAVLTSLNLTANRITLTDGSVVLTDIPGVQQTYHFDAKGNKTTDYTFLFAKIKAYETQPKSALDSFVESQAKTLSPVRSDLVTTETTQADGYTTTTATYDSPDVQNGKIVITFDNQAGTVQKGSNVKTITFTGDKPQSVD